MMRKTILIALAVAGLSSPALARPNSPPAPKAQVEPAEPVEIDVPPPPGADAGEENGETAEVAVPSDTVAEPAPVVTAADVVEPVATAPVNPYANSYNELLPLEPELAEEARSQGFDDWGLLGLLGLLGLFGLKRRDRVVYAERVEE